MQKLHYRVLIILLVYGLLKFFGGSFGRMALYPVTLLVTFLHEFGHALGALITGGTVEGLQINPDGSGYTITRGGSQAIVLMGGYLGSAFFMEFTERFQTLSSVQLLRYAIRKNIHSAAHHLRTGLYGSCFWLVGHSTLAGKRPQF